MDSLYGVSILAVILLVLAAAIWLAGVLLALVLPLVLSLSRSFVQAARDNQDKRRITARHPRFWRFVSARLHPHRFDGLPLTILAAGFAYLLSLYLGLVFDLLTKGPIVEADIRLSNLFHALREAELVAFFTAVSATGKWPFVIVLAIGISLGLLAHGRCASLFGLWLTLAGNQITVTLLKNLFARPRPDHAVYLETSFSFPSGHAAVSVAFYGFIAFILLRERILRLPMALLFGLGAAGLIGASRLYLGVHYLSDVLNGYLVGAMWLALGIGLTEWWTSAAPPGLVNRAGHLRRPLILLALVEAAVLAAFVAWHPTSLTEAATPPAPRLVEDIKLVLKAPDFTVYSETLTGTRQEPISLVIITKDAGSLRAAFEAAGWLQTQKPGFLSLARAGFAAWFNRTDPRAPVTPGFWRQQPNDFGFQKSGDDQGLRTRHHARFWRADLVLPDGQAVFVGTASFDDGLKWGITHRIAPDIDRERDFLVSNLTDSRRVATLARIQMVRPEMGHNFTGDAFFTDGQAVIVTLGPVVAEN